MNNQELGEIVISLQNQLIRLLDILEVATKKQENEKRIMEDEIKLVKARLDVQSLRIKKLETLLWDS